MQIDIWKEAERNELMALPGNSGVNGSLFIDKDARTLQYSEQLEYNENTLQALVIKRTIRNTKGEYFYWIWRSDSPRYLRHIPQDNAKIILKKDYLEP